MHSNGIHRQCMDIWNYLFLPSDFFSLWKHFSVQINIYQVVKKITVSIFPFIQINISLINLDKAWKSKCILNILKEEHVKNNNYKWLDKFSSVQSFSHVRLFATPWTAVHQASLSITNSRSLLKLMSIELVMPPNHLILCCPLLLLPSIFPTIKVFSNESVLCIRWPEYWSFSFSISPCNEYSGLISFRIDWLGLLAS